MITLQSGETDKIIVIDAASAPGGPEEIVGLIHVTQFDMDNSIIESERIFIKRNMLGTSIGVYIKILDFVAAYIDSFNVTPTTVQVTQTDTNILSVQIPTEVLEENIELNVTIVYRGIL